jgi:hypothetical protein
MLLWSMSHVMTSFLLHGEWRHFSYPHQGSRNCHSQVFFAFLVLVYMSASVRLHFPSVASSCLGK